MTKLISIFIVIVVIFCAWQGYKYWEGVRDNEQKQSATKEVRPEYLPGMPSELQDSYSKAKDKGPTVMRTWLKTYGHMLYDPRKAWIELDFCTSVARDNPAEARQVFADVKARTPESSPVWPRIKQLEKSFE